MKYSFIFKSKQFAVLFILIYSLYQNTHSDPFLHWHMERSFLLQVIFIILAAESEINGYFAAIKFSISLFSPQNILPAHT